MSADFDKLREVFLAALEQAPDQREAYLDQLCAADQQLRRNVAVMLKAHDAGEGPLDRGALRGQQTGDYEQAAEKPGTVIGPYKLLEQIGEGGFGVVFMAEQTEPLRRKVAMKILKPGMDTRQVVARFEAERQALAIMEHPNIAKVLDAGRTQSGRPYFVMDLVKGVPITDFCDQNQLRPVERLGLFISVCQAVQHAHQKGIIHRDIKPSNVLVTLHDGTPLVKVIDFGIAKAIGQQLTGKTLFTGFAQMIGSPLYMSPEQAALSNVDVDTRSDIYSLGVLLYELLTGTTPFDRERLHAAGYDELRRIIREEEPPKPSTRVTTLGQAATTVSTQRRSEPRQLSRLFRGELDWIVMKALEKDRNRRYESASALAADVQRYLADEPVQACPPSAWYRFRKFARRNKRSMLAASLVILALAGGSIGTTMGLIRAESQRRIAEDNEKTAKEREAETKAVLDFVEHKILAAARPEGWEGGLGREVTLRKTVEAALPFVEKGFPKQPLIEARLRMTLGLSFQYLGEAKIAAEQFQTARVIYSQHLGPDHPDTLASMNSLAGTYRDLGRHADAFQLHKETLALRKAKLGPDHPDTLASMHNLAGSYVALDQFTEALELYEATVAIKKAKLGPGDPSTLLSVDELAWTYGVAFGRYADALKLREEALALRKAELGSAHPDTLGSMHNLAATYYAIGRYADAAKLQEATLALSNTKLGPNHAGTLGSMYALANYLCALDRYAEGIKLLHEIVSLRKAKLGPTHPDTLRSMNNLAWVLATCPEAKLRDPKRAVELAKKIIELVPRQTLTEGNYWLSLEAAYCAAGDWKAAEAALRKSMDLRKGGDSYEWFFLAMAKWNLGDKEQARQWYERAVQGMTTTLTPNNDARARDDLRHIQAEAAALMGIPDSPSKVDAAKSEERRPEPKK